MFTMRKKKCVYCQKKEPAVQFNNEEHVIPQSLGGKPFPGINKKLVCSDCNSLVFSKLETAFKQDSIEGVFAQMMPIDDPKTVWIRGKNLKLNPSLGFGDRFFDEMFPFLEYENDKLVFVTKSQLKVRNKHLGYQIFPLDTLVEIRDKVSKVKFKKIKERLSKASLSDLVLFTGVDDDPTKPMDDAISLLKDYGINYKERVRKYSPIEKMKGTKISLDWVYEIDQDRARIIAKIAFNYFIYCSMEEGDYAEHLLFKNNFDRIRNFIYKGDGNWKDIVKVTDRKHIVDFEAINDLRLNSHTIYFELRGEMIVASITIFGNLIYEVELGKYPLEDLHNKFGCGHIFHPFSKSVSTIGPNVNSLRRKYDPGYGWFKV